MLVVLCSRGLNAPVTQQLLLEGAAGISPLLTQVCSSPAVVSHNTPLKWETGFVPAPQDHATSSSRQAAARKVPSSPHFPQREAGPLHPVPVCWSRPALQRLRRFRWSERSRIFRFTPNQQEAPRRR